MFALLSRHGRGFEAGRLDVLADDQIGRLHACNFIRARGHGNNPAIAASGLRICPSSEDFNFHRRINVTHTILQQSNAVSEFYRTPLLNIQTT